MNIGNSLKAAKTVVTSKAGRQLLKGQKHSPAILFGAGVIGVVATTVLACRATLQLEEVLSENERKNAEAHDLHELNKLGKEPNYSPADYKKDVTVLKVRFCKDVARLYAPSFAVGVLSIAALGGSHHILNKRYTGALAAYATLDKGFKDYQKRVLEAVGPEKERELRLGSEEREIAEDGKNGVEVKNVKTAIGGSPYAKFFSKETAPTTWDPNPDYNLVFLKANQTWCNDQLRAKGHLFLSEVYDQLGLERTKESTVTGWIWNSKTGDNFVDFGIFENPDRFHDFMVGREGAILLDFNVDGVIWNLI